MASDNDFDKKTNKDHRKLRNAGIGIGALTAGAGVGYAGLKIGSAADKLKRSTPAHVVDKIKASWKRFLNGTLKSQRMSSKRKLIQFAKPGEMFKKYVPDSEWNDKQFRPLRDAAVKKHKGVLVPKYDYTTADMNKLEALKHQHQAERDKAKAAGKDKQHLEAMAKRHHTEREAVKAPTRYKIQKPTPNLREMLKADISTNVDHSHDEYHESRKSLLAKHATERARFADADDTVTASLKKKHSQQEAKLRNDYVRTVTARESDATRLLRRGRIRSSMAEGLNDRRRALQAIRKHVTGSLPAPLPAAKMDELKRAAKEMPDVGIGESSRHVKTGIASNHGKGTPFKLAGKIVPDLPERLAETDRDITEAVAGQGKRLDKRYNRLYDYVLKRARKNLKAGLQVADVPAEGADIANSPRKLGHLQKKTISKRVLENRTREVAHQLFKPEAPSGLVRQRIARSLKYTPEMVDKIHEHQRSTGIWKDTDAGEKTLKKQIAKEGRIFVQPPEPQGINKYPHLKSAGKGAAIGAGVLGVGYLVKKLLDKRKERNKEKRFSSDFGSKEEEIHHHAERARLAARRQDAEVYREAGIKAGILKPWISRGLALDHMKNARDKMIDDAYDQTRRRPKSNREMYQLGRRRGLSINNREAFQQGQKKAGTIAAQKIAIASKEAEAAGVNAVKIVPEAAKANRSKVFVGTAAGLIGGGLTGYAIRKKKKDETQFSSKKMSPAVKTGISAAASGAVLGALPAFRRGTKLKTILKSIAGGAGLGATLGGGGTYVGTKILGDPKRGEGAAFTKRAALGGGILGAAGGITAGVLAHKTKYGRQTLERLAKEWRPAEWARRSGMLGAAGIGGAAGGLLSAAHAADEGQQVDTLQALTKAKRKTHTFGVISRIKTMTHDKVLHDGTRIDIKRLNEIVGHKAVKNYPIHKLKPVSKSKRSGFSEKRLKKANPDVPILINHEGEVIDGRHRVIKKQMAGHTHIRAIRVTQKDLADVKMSAIYFEQPRKKLNVAMDRYRKKIHEQERQRQESNLTRSAVAGSLLAAALRKQGSLGKTLAVGAGAGLATQAALIASTRNQKDAFGERSYAAKRTEKLPYQLGGLAALGIAGRKIYKSLHKFAEKDDDPFVIPWLQPKRWKNRSLPRRADEIITTAKRAKALKEDLEAKRAGKPIVDERGREKTPEWKKPYAKTALAGSAIVAAIAGLKILGKKSKAMGSVYNNAKNIVKKVPGVEKTAEFVKGVGSDTSKLISSMDNAVAKKVASAAEKKEQELLSAAEEERKRKRALKAMETGTKFASKGRVLKFAETVQDWDIRDQRGKSARIYAPGSQKRTRRQKEWYEKKDNQRRIWEGIAAASGATGVGGTIAYYKRKNRPQASPEPYIGVRVGEESILRMPAQSRDKYLWARRLRNLSSRIDRVIELSSITYHETEADIRKRKAKVHQDKASAALTAGGYAAAAGTFAVSNKNIRDKGEDLIARAGDYLRREKSGVIRANKGKLFKTAAFLPAGALAAGYVGHKIGAWSNDRKANKSLKEANKLRLDRNRIIMQRIENTYQDRLRHPDRYPPVLKR